MVPKLLQITTTPIKFEMETQHARLEPQLDIQPRASVRTETAKVNVNTQNAAVLIDTYEARRSLGMNNFFDFTSLYRDRAKELSAKTNRENTDIGVAISRIDIGNTISSVYKQRFIDKSQMTLYATFLPSAGPDVSWMPHQVNTTHQEAGLDINWEEMRNSLNYVPGDVRISILQHPGIEIEYLGSPLYMPPSADPNYEEAQHHYIETGNSYLW